MKNNDEETQRSDDLILRKRKQRVLEKMSNGLKFHQINNASIKRLLDWKLNYTYQFSSIVAQSTLRRTITKKTYSSYVLCN